MTHGASRKRIRRGHGHGEQNRSAQFVPLLSARRRSRYRLAVGAWVLGLGYFWTWWLQPQHNSEAWGFLLVTAILAWICFLPLYYLFFFLRAREPAPDNPVPDGLRVAMVVTKAPSEPFRLVRKTLEAMLAQDYPHDTWLADEKPDIETILWCRANGVRVSTRFGRPDYHRASWPRRTRCKEGNLAFFYDHFGYRHYDFVSQLDADHVPTPNYLREMLRPFDDPSVGYVSAPSICDGNAAHSWSARSRLYAEAMLHGTLQAGYNGGWAPMCIGSHYAVRTRALREIGGLGPELAEDHSTSLMMNAHGWRGTHAIRAIAHGDGPQTFADLVTQEFQWSRSLVTILLKYTPRYFAGLPARLKFQFLFSQLWYPIHCTIMALTFFLPIAALLRKSSFVDVNYLQFLLHFLPMGLALVFLAFQLKRDGLLRPVDAKIISWERSLFFFAQWPWALAGCLVALIDYLRGRFVDFRITPKGGEIIDPPPYRALLPYFALCLVSASAVLLQPHVGDAAGFYLFAATNASIYALLLIVVLVRHGIENRGARQTILMRNGLRGGFVALATTLSICAVGWRGTEALDALSRGAGPITLTTVTYSVSGAGSENRGIRHVRLQFGWDWSRL